MKLPVSIRAGSKSEAPGLFRKWVPTRVNYELSGVYVFLIPNKQHGTYVRVGSARVLRKGITGEWMLLGDGPRKTVQVYVLDQGDMDKEERLSSRRKWIRFFQQHAPAGHVLNGRMTTRARRLHSTKNRK